MINEMTLPLEYTELSEYFDALCCGNEDVRNRSVEAILKKHGIKTVLDLTCGTGSQVFWLARRGYDVTGSDFSPKLVKIAQDKAAQEKMNVRLLDGDMRTLQAGRFDAVITIANAVGHLTKPDFEKAMQNIHSNLKDGGLYVFDIFNLSSMNDAVVADLKMDNVETVGNTQARNIQYSTLDREHGLLTSYDHFSLQKDGESPRTLEGQFTLQIYTAQELRDMLARNGFEVLEQMGWDGRAFEEHETQNIVTVARRV
jgi:SAM-dependent methyltransferase